VRAYGIHVGNSDSRGTRQYSYDSADRLTAVNAVGGASLSYDAAGRLGALLANGVSTRFVYDGGQLTGEVDGNGVMIRRYVPLPGPDETLAMYDSTGVSYPLADSRGTPMAWTLANGQIAVQQYGAFGEEGPANIGRFGFTGHFCVGADRTTPLARRYDPRVRLPEIGLDYYKARFYDPSIGRFLTPDPAGTIDSPNLYAYVLNDPVNNTDPSGLMGEVYTCAYRPGGEVGPTALPGGGVIPGFRIPGGLVCFLAYTPPAQGPVSATPTPTPAPPTGMMMEAEEARESLCDSINREVERTRAKISDFSFNNPEALRLDRAVVQLDLQVINTPAAFLGVGVTGAGAASAIPVQGTTGVRFARASFAGGLAAGFLGFLVSRDLAKIAAIDARLRQLDAQAAGVCK
jgi:RHS repeat-associated protein